MSGEDMNHKQAYWHSAMIVQSLPESILQFCSTCSSRPPNKAKWMPGVAKYLSVDGIGTGFAIQTSCDLGIVSHSSMQLHRHALEPSITCGNALALF